LNRNMNKLAKGLLGGGLALLLLAGCGGGKAAESPAPAPATTPASSGTPAAAAPAANDALGKELYTTTAGGTGCLKCHGADGKGDKVEGGPDIRGKTEADVRNALETVELMQEVKLSDEEITAVTKYLAELDK